LRFSLLRMLLHELRFLMRKKGGVYNSLSKKKKKSTTHHSSLHVVSLA
jgi:hypothetical protein